MALSNQAVRAIAIRRAIQGRQQASVGKASLAANDNGKKGNRPSMLQNCIDSAGFAEHAAY